MAALATVLTLTRSSYQWIWVALIFATLWFQLPKNRSQIQVAALVALFFSLLWPAKNAFLFGHFNSTTWAPLSISKHWDADNPVVENLVRRGLLHTYAPPDESNSQFEERLRKQWQAPPTGFPELDDITRPDGGALNWNSLTMLNLLNARQKDDSVLLRSDPRDYVVRAAQGAMIYFYPSEHYYITVARGERGTRDIMRNYLVLQPFDSFVGRICCNPLGFAVDPEPDRVVTSGRMHHIVNVLAQLCLGALLLYALFFLSVLSLGRTVFWQGAHESRVALAVISVTVIYGALVGNLAEIGENERFRFETHALVFIVVAVFLHQLWQRRIATK
ncbi:MAG: hypothetical protein WBW84_08530 [Acidobacteriaceae bacterium]